MTSGGAERSGGGRVAAIDIGTNSVLLTIAEVSAEAGGALCPLVERATITRLGEGVDKTRRLAPDAIARTLQSLADYAAILREHGPARLDVVGTSAMRDAAGGEAFVERATELLGARPRVISGDEEARLTFSGGLSGLSIAAGKVLVFDIGGGSTELILGAASPPAVQRSVSLDVGSVRLTERHVRSDPPSPSELAALDRDLEAALATFALEPVDAVVGVAGTVTSIAAIARRVEPYDATVIHGMRLSTQEVAEAGELLDGLSVAERTKLPGLSPKRADVIAAGAHICLGVLRAAGAEALIVSDRGVRWGLLEALASAQPGRRV